MAKKKAALGDLSSRALCVDADFSWWQAIVTDKKVSDDVADRNKVSKKAGKYQKNLFPFERNEYDALHEKVNDAYKFYERHTVPWGYGVRLLKASFFGEFKTKMKGFAEEIETLKRAFIKVYPQYIERAEEELNGMFRVEDYPEIAVLKHKFGLLVKYSPVVAPGDFRLELDEDLMKELREQHAVEFTQSQSEMNKKLWKRIYDTVNRAAKLKGKGVKVYDSVFTDLDELAEALPLLNILDDPEMNRLGDELKRNLSGRTADVVRKDDTERNDVATKAEELARKMKKIMEQTA